MSLLDELTAEVDPDGWLTANDFDEMLFNAHPLEYKPRKKDDKLRISWSLLKNGMGCPRSATWAAYPEKFNISPEALKFTDSIASMRGNLVQVLLEHTYAHNFLSLDPTEFVKALKASWRWGVKFYQPTKIMSDAELLKVRGEIFDSLQKIFMTLNRENLWAERREVEKPLWWDMLPGVRLTGKADFVLSDPGKYWLVDGKWSARPEFLDAKQLTFYAVILQKMSGKTPNRALFWLYPQESVIDHSADCLSPSAFHAVLQDANQVVQQIRSLDISTNPSRFKCKLCMHREHCSDADK